MLVAIGLSVLLRRTASRWFGQGAERPVVRIAERFVSYVVIAAGVVYALQALRVQIGPLIGALGIGGIALAFALQDILQNLVAGVIIQARRPIRIGDQVELGAFSGTVRDIDLRTVLIRTYDGLDVYLPNKTVLENAIVNLTISPLRRLRLDLGVGYDTDLDELQAVLVDAVTAVDQVLAEPEPAAWITGFGDSAVECAVLCWFPATANIWQVRSDVAVAVRSAMRRAGVAIPFPQRTLTFSDDRDRVPT